MGVGRWVNRGISGLELVVNAAPRIAGAIGGAIGGKPLKHALTGLAYAGEVVVVGAYVALPAAAAVAIGSPALAAYKSALKSWRERKDKYG